MSELYGMPQPLTGAETITVQQMQNGQLVKCTVSLTVLAAFFGNTPAVWSASLPTALPATHGVLWNDGGVISVS
jgi:hypothetical protein